MVERIQSKRRRIMKDFRITELSAVDRPAQGHALAVLMKRADDEQEYGMQVQKVGGDRVASFDSFEEAMQAIREREGCAQLRAMEEAASRHPDLLRKYNDEGERIAKAAQDAAAPKPVAMAVTDFNRRVDEVMARDKVNKLEAMEKAAREFPAELDAYQSA